MPQIPGWKEVESEVYCPGRWLALSVGAFFLLTGIIGFVAVGRAAPPGIPFWIATSGTAVFALLGGLVFAWAVGRIISPVHIRHAAPDVLPDVPKEPVICEGSVVHGRLTHELCEDAQGWQFRPAGSLRRNDMVFLFGFGIPSMVLFAGLMTWVLHSQLNFAGWPVSALCATTATLVCGGTALAAIGLLMRFGCRRLSRLSIPRNGDNLELDSPLAPKLDNADLMEGLKWVFFGGDKRQRLTIPRALLAAVQLCPWKYKLPSEIGWTVQGLLVLASPEEAAYHRLPILLTSDFVGAARLMQRLAHALNVPYLFCADAEGWKAEEIRAKERPPLRTGGSLN